MRQGGVDGVVHLLDDGVAGGALHLQRFGQTPGEESQATDAEGQVMLAKEADRGRQGADILRQLVRSHGAHMAPEGLAIAFAHERAFLPAQAEQQVGQILDDAGQLEMAISGKGEAGGTGRPLLRLVAPGGKPCRRRPVEE